MKNIKKIILPFLLIIIFSFNTSCSTNNMKPEDFKNKEPRLIMARFKKDNGKLIRLMKIIMREQLEM